ncbi:MAG: pilus assembly protein [Candidatus Nephthysia bennettiae]|uniref:Flp family type IVb pilin n=2 Tax=Candidatus Nephthysia bennettiae TaxID=3127016 RepID=A0A934K074_9BACT|nr:Flp family type IVb pilin [Candidatus Dormibacteraeota bacterium]MBJ7615000.1 Flp family type IVb pilin [Candidatus Dormibacteraeota bacterium]PZR97950.1 MAG: pilus assembly protein [Candidatus Dormibacteraeota bacterium]
MVEYALILVLVAIIVIAVLTTMGPQLSVAFKDVVNEVSRTRS